MLTRMLMIVLVISLTGPTIAEESRNHGPTLVSHEDCKKQEQETRLGYFAFEHCNLHKFYGDTFVKVWNCNCGEGRCRPTVFRDAPISKDNPFGIEVFVDGKWYAVPSDKLRMGQAGMPPELFEWEAHVCASNAEKPTIECVWLRLPS